MSISEHYDIGSEKYQIQSCEYCRASMSMPLHHIKSGTSTLPGLTWCIYSVCPQLHIHALCASPSNCFVTTTGIVPKTDNIKGTSLTSDNYNRGPRNTNCGGRITNSCLRFRHYLPTAFTTSMRQHSPYYTGAPIFHCRLVIILEWNFLAYIFSSPLHSVQCSRPFSRSRLC